MEVCFSTEKWDSHEEEAQMKYNILFQGCLAQDARWASFFLIIADKPYIFRVVLQVS